MAYADQNEKDYVAMVKAVKAGRIKAVVEEEGTHLITIAALPIATSNDH